MKYIPTIGLEIHVELKTNSKMFCPCRNNPQASIPNTNVCPVCMGHPGTLPVINKKAVELVIKTGLALYCGVQEETWFERKNYFYPDLPKGYQISQYAAPLCRNGFLKIKDKQIKVERVHLEEDTAKLTHPKKTHHSLVDFNRAGVPLMELVTAPDIHAPDQARQFGKELQLLLRYLQVSEANMEKGEMRIEANISLAPEGSEKLGSKVEIKNLNSLRSVEKATQYEIGRQQELLNRGGRVLQETRGWHDTKQITFPQRTKERARDYRYFPEPDLPPLNIKQDLIDEIKITIPELAQSKRKRFLFEYGLKQEDVEFYINNRRMSEYFEEVMSELDNWLKVNKKIRQDRVMLACLASNYISNHQAPLSLLNITPENFAEFIKMLAEKEISSKIAKDLLERMVKTGGDPSQIVKDEGLKLVSDESELQELVAKVIKDNPGPVGDYKSGKKEALKFLMGQVMAETQGRADPETARDLLKEELS